jgi:hypothetical protein
MLQIIQRLLHRGSPEDAESTLLKSWAESRGGDCRSSRRGLGLKVRSRSAAGDMRLEWGLSQRRYIDGPELRLRVDAGLPAKLEMLVMSRCLAEQLEAQTYELLTHDAQTEINGAAPQEVRWLAMFERIEDLLPPAFAEAFVVVGSNPVHARHWAQGELAVRLQRAQDRWLAPEAPLLLMTLRGRLYLRTAAANLDETLLDGVRSLAEAGALRARRICERSGRGEDRGSASQSTLQSAVAGLSVAAAGAQADMAGAGKSPSRGSQRPLDETGGALPMVADLDGMEMRTADLATFSEEMMRDFSPTAMAGADEDLPTELPPLDGNIPTDLTL